MQVAKLYRLGTFDPVVIKKHCNTGNIFSFRTSWITEQVIIAGNIYEVLFSQPILYWPTYTEIKPLQKYLNGQVPIMSRPCKSYLLFPYKVLDLVPIDINLSLRLYHNFKHFQFLLFQEKCVVLALLGRDITLFLSLYFILVEITINHFIDYRISQ